MIGFHEIGRLGRFGNQLFQYCALVSVAKKNNYKYGIPLQNTKVKKEFSTTKISYRCDIFDIFKKDEECILYDSHQYSSTYEDTGQQFKSEFFLIKDNTNLHGYFQTEKYFIWCENEIRNKLEFRKDILTQSISVCDVTKLKDPIAVHIRRGDYLKVSHVHPTCPIEYYKSAFDKLNANDRDILFFSDDTEWVSKNLTQYVKKYNIIDTKCHLKDFIIMSLCKDFIIANSSYSWWAAWLNKNKLKKVICPRVWFGDKKEITIQQDTRGFEIL